MHWASVFPGTARIHPVETGATPMRSLLILYLVIGIVLLALGFLATGACPEKNKDVVSNVVFVLGWPVYLYDDVVHGNLTAPEWLHKQACEGGVGTKRTELIR